jgi:hypothetical protein
MEFRTLVDRIFRRQATVVNVAADHIISSAGAESLADILLEDTHGEDDLDIVFCQSRRPRQPWQAAYLVDVVEDGYLLQRLAPKQKEVFIRSREQISFSHRRHGRAAPSAKQSAA